MTEIRKPTGGNGAPRRMKAYMQVAEDLRRLIFNGELVKGQQLSPERDLAESLGVSRVVVREAIRALESDGLIMVREGAGGGTFVTHDFDKPLTASLNNHLAGGAITLDHLFELRLMLEPPAAAMAALRGSPEEVTELDQIVGAAEALTDDSEALRAANLEFHRRMVALAGNPLLSSLCETVLAILVESLKGRLNVDLSLRVLSFHRRIVEAIKAGRAEEARALTAQDLEQLHKRYQMMGIRVDLNSAKEPAARAMSIGRNIKSGRDQ